MVKAVSVTVGCKMTAATLAAASTFYHTVSYPVFNFRYINPIYIMHSKVPVILLIVQYYQIYSGKQLWDNKVTL
jgi:hypothetical protein